MDQLVEIIKVLGTPSRDQIHAMNPNYSEFKFPQIKPTQLIKIFSRKSSSNMHEAVNLIDKILKYNPDQRLKPMECLQQPFFNDLRKKETSLPNNKEMPTNLFNFSDEEIGSTTSEVIKALTPQWYLEQQKRK